MTIEEYVILYKATGKGEQELASRYTLQPRVGGFVVSTCIIAALACMAFTYLSKFKQNFSTTGVFRSYTASNVNRDSIS